MMTAAGVVALLGIAYAKLVDGATQIMAVQSTSHPWLFLAAAPCLTILAFLLVRFGAPSASGSGIPQVLAATELASREGTSVEPPHFWDNVRLIAVKTASSLVALIGGCALGREGPTVQMGAAVFDLLDGVFGRFASKRKSREALLIAGGAAGLAAAFNTPLGGVVFAIEELSKNHFKHFKGVLILAVVTAGYVTQAWLGPYLYVGHPAIGDVSWRDTLTGLVAAGLIGMAGAGFGELLFRTMQRVTKLPLKHRILLAGAVGLVMAGVCLLLGPDASGGGVVIMKKLLFNQKKHVSWALALWRAAGVYVTYLSGCAGGIFAPSLAAGATLGAKFAELLGSDNPNLLMVLGMIAYLAGATRSPFTSFILVFEMTDRQSAVMPMMAAALVASVTARFISEHGFYEKMCEILMQPRAAAPKASTS